MREVGIAHLSHLVATSTKPGGKVLTANTRPGKTKRDSVDKRFLTPVTAGAHFVDAVIEGSRVNGMYDTGSNVTLMNARLAR